MAEVITIDSDEENMDDFLSDLERAIEESLLKVPVPGKSTNTSAASLPSSSSSSSSSSFVNGQNRIIDRQQQTVETITIDSDDDDDIIDILDNQLYNNNRRVLTSSGISNQIATITPFNSNNRNTIQSLSSYSTNHHRTPVSIVDPVLELTDPHPDIFNLYREFDQTFFQCQLSTKPIVVEWNNQFTTCAGAFSTMPGIPGSSIKLSSKLLSLVPRAELVNTLLHEMIHAFVFYFHPREPGNFRPHGKFFRLHMNRINSRAGTRITVYHSFHQETLYLNRNKAKNKFKRNINHANFSN